MNPALLHNPLHFDYSLNTDNKYLGQGRNFSNSAPFAPSEFAFVTRRSQNGLNSSSLAQPVPVPTNPSLDYNSHSSIPQNPYHPGSSFLLNSPSSVDNSHTNGVQPTSSSFTFSDSSKLATSNASSTDQFPSSIPQFTGSPWIETTMTDLRPPRPSPLQPTVSSLVGYSHQNSMPGPYLSSTNRAIEHYPSSYSMSRPINGPDIQSSLFRNPRSPIFNSLPIPMPTHYSMNNHFSAMQPQQSGRSEGPPFEDTKIIHTLMTDRSQPLSPEIAASIQKGFFQVDGKWTCYRRNYFTVSCAFTYKGGVPDGHVYLQRSNQLVQIHQYAVSISAKTANVSNQDSESRQLVQHTPKRDKATESIPGRHLVQPAPPQSLQANGYLPAPTLYGGGQHVPPGLLSGYETFGTQNHPSIPNSYTFERIQFQKATANNGKRRAQQQYFHVVVELSVNVGRPGVDDNWVVVATRQSQPMVVRGRSPGHYKDNVRRDGQTNMDPDRGHGPGTDGGHINLPMPHFMGNGQSSSMDWTSSGRSSHHYGSSYARYPYGPDGSPHSASSSTTLTKSPVESTFQLLDVTTSRIGSPPAYDQTLSASSSRQRNSLLDSHTRKRSHEDDPSDYSHEYYNSATCADDGFSPRSFDYSSGSSTKPLCASS